MKIIQRLKEFFLKTEEIQTEKTRRKRHLERGDVLPCLIFDGDAYSKLNNAKKAFGDILFAQVYLKAQDLLVNDDLEIVINGKTMVQAIESTLEILESGHLCSCQTEYLEEVKRNLSTNIRPKTG